MVWCAGGCGGSSAGRPDAADAGDGNNGGDDGGYLPDGGDEQTEEEPPVPGPVIEIDSARESDAPAYHVFGTITPGPDGSPVVSSTFSLNDSEPAALALDQGAFGVDVELLAGRNVVAVEAEDQAGNVRREAIMVFYRTGLPSSLDLIDAAEAAGTITAEEALSYRVFAAFKDSRLPAEYRGDDTQGNFDYVVDQLIAAVPTLSEKAKDTLGPFLAPLIYQDPATFPTKGKGPAPKAEPCNPLRVNDCPVASGWESVAGATVRVWYMTVMTAWDQSKAQAVLDALEGPPNGALKLTALMGRAPLSDGGGYFDGGDEKLDIILGDVEGHGWTWPSNILKTKETPVFITLPRGDPVEVLKSNAVHEYMHAIQYSTPLKGISPKMNYPTLSESSAVWASHYVLSSFGNRVHHEANKYFLPFVDQGLLSQAHEDMPYGAWLFLLCVENTISPNVIRELWDATAKNDEREAYISAFRSHNGLEEVWPKCAKSFWNREPEKDLENWDKIKGGAKPVGGQAYTASALGAGIDKTDAPASLPFLAAAYKQIQFPDPTTRSVLLLNGMTYRLGEETPSSIKVAGPAVYTADAAAVKGAALWGIEKINGNWRKAADWTTMTGGSGRGGYHLYCRERDEERLEELVLITSFADTSRSDQTYSPPGNKTTLIYADVFCEAASGQANFTYQEPGATRKRTFTASNFSFERGDEFVMPAKGDGSVIYGWLFKFKGGDVVFSASGSFGTCTYSGNDRKSISAESDAMMMAVLPFCTTVPRAYAFTGFVDDVMKFKETETCTDPQTGDTTTNTNEIEAYTTYGFETILIPVFTPQNEWAGKWSVKSGGRAIEGDAKHLWFDENTTGSWNVTSTK